jgi:hypothetical protein
MAKRQCAAGTQASLCLPQWTVLKVSLARLGCSHMFICSYVRLLLTSLVGGYPKPICLPQTCRLV